MPGLDSSQKSQEFIVLAADFVRSRVFGTASEVLTSESEAVRNFRSLSPSERDVMTGLVKAAASSCPNHLKASHRQLEKSLAEWHLKSCDFNIPHLVGIFPTGLLICVWILYSAHFLYFFSFSIEPVHFIFILIFIFILFQFILIYLFSVYYLFSFSFIFILWIFFPRTNYI
jgi:hypothetical protein